MRTLGGDVIGVPLSSRVDDDGGFGDERDGAGSVSLVGTLIEDIRLVAIIGKD